MAQKMSFIDQTRFFFDPNSVAVVGASRKENKAGYVIFKNFAENRRKGIFKGELYPVNPNEDLIFGYKCFPSVTDIPIEEVELVVVVVPASLVPKIMEESAAKNVKAAIIISSGFSEIGNRELEDKVKTIITRAGIRVLGPNCLGVYVPQTGIDTLFLPETKVLITGEEVIATPRPMKGEIAVVTQSGAFGVAALDYLAGRQLGISKFVSFGNRIDVDESDLLLYFLDDPDTKGILFYLEGVKDGKRFMDIARKVTVRKPIVALKTGKTKAGAKAAMSHTGSIAGSDDVYNSAFLQTGIIRARDMEEFFDACKALVSQPPALGNNIVIITDAGGPSIMAVDECELRGLNIGELSDFSKMALEEMRQKNEIPRFANISNPIDLTGSVTTDMLVKAAKIVFDDPVVNGVIFLGLHHVPGLQEDFVDRIAVLSRSYTKPLIACDIGETEMALHIRSKFEKLGVPCYASPEDAARAMSALYVYGTYLKDQGCLEYYLSEFKKM
ncbi:MAG: acetate--CoA ligase family protein [Nitrososphaeria archaeon]